MVKISNIYIMQYIYIDTFIFLFCSLAFKVNIYFFYLTFIYPGKLIENHFSFTNMTWPRGNWKK